VSTLAVEGLRVRLPTPAGDVTVVDGVDYEVQPAEVFGIAGESGSGKTVSMLALLGLLPEGSTAARPTIARSSCWTTCASPTRVPRCGGSRTNSRAVCVSGSRLRSLSPAGRDC
jgi:ABC-type dipeptide/oligopeptide/nickel transport system ATPase component